MSELIVPHPAMVVALDAIATRLPAEFADVDVVGRIDDRTPRMVVISRNPGGGVPHHGATDHAAFLIECWAGNEPAAEWLAVNVNAVWRSLAGQWAKGAFIRRAAAQAPYDWPDVDVNGQARWQFTADLDIKVG
ncbi:hypothetical protein [Rhodococcoides fascians]|uniref:hypothetical protein n=1 Tax=Rhodococcoides fascians TaxID=1828 RepID=UPI000522E70A|nr:hypothetical protein [Rhodococcus fascians]